MSLTRTSMRFPVGTVLISIAVAVLGLISLRSLPVAYWPDITPSFLIVQAPYPGVSPEDIEEEVTKPLERAVSQVDDIYELESSSTEGFSQLTIRFDWGVDVERAKIDVRDKIEAARRNLPRDLEQISILALDALLPAPVELAVSSDELDQAAIRTLLEDKIVSRFQRLPNVASVSIRGGRNRVVRVQVDPDALHALGLTMDAVTAAVGRENVDTPAGSMLQGESDLLIRTFNKYDSLEEIGQVVVARTGLTPVRLNQIATVMLINDDPVGLARVNGQPVLILSLRQTSGGNTVALKEEVSHELSRVQDAFPSLAFRVIKDDSAFIRSSIRAVTFNVALGALLAAVVIFLFLGSIRNTLLIALSIPVSVLATFMVLSSLGLSINTISLGGLALGVGMIVDASIVVLENAFTRLKQRINAKGQLTAGERLTTIADATGEVMLPVLASVTTSIVVFLPLAFTKGLAFFLLGELSLTVVSALLFSLLAAFTLVPTLSHQMMSVHEPRFLPARAWNGMLETIIRAYRPTLNFTCGRPWRALLTLLIAAALFVVPIIILQKLDVEQFPEINQGQVRIDIELPVGTELERTDSIIRDIEQRALDTQGTESVYSVTGLTAFYNQPSHHTAYLSVLFTPEETTADSMIARLERGLPDYPDTRMAIRTLSVGEGIRSSGLELKVVGPELAMLRTISEQILDSLRARGKLINLSSNMQRGNPEWLIHVDRMKAAAWGLSPSTVATMVRTAVEGSQVSTYSTPAGNRYDVIVSLDRNRYRSTDALRNLQLPTPYGIPVRLETVADFENQPGPAEIRRSDQQRFVSVGAEGARGVLEKEVRTIGQEIMEHLELPDGYAWRTAGASRALTESFQSLGIALLLALFLVYVVMATQFNSLWQPLVIGVSIPFAYIGAMLGLLVFNAALNINSILGMIMLTGIVVNNGILLIDFINRGRREGQARLEAMILAGQRRIRPILMTILTTILGMLFLALGVGVGSESLLPLGAAVVGGLLFSTLLTLLLMPAVYTLFDAFFDLFRRDRKATTR